MAAPQPGLYTTISAAAASVGRRSRVSPHLAFTVLLDWHVFTLKATDCLCISECRCLSPSFNRRVHEIWARSFSSSLKDDLRYAPSDCFRTFPFPEGFETDATLEAAGEAYHTFRAAADDRSQRGPDQDL